LDRKRTENFLEFWLLGQLSFARFQRKLNPVQGENSKIILEEKGDMSFS
jgi:hypothetical protein